MALFSAFNAAITAVLLLTVAGGEVAAQSASEPVPAIGGRWEGELTNFPLRPTAPRVRVTVELGSFPVTDNTCVPWKTTYAERDTVRAVKDYQLCRGTGAQDLFVDEGGGVRLKASLLGGVLVSAFKTGPILLLTHLRVDGDMLEEEIVTIDDQPATEGLVTMRTRGIQRLRLTRVSRR